jgi:tetratricopeptide (TPR) repeat protein
MQSYLKEEEDIVLIERGEDKIKTAQDSSSKKTIFDTETTDYEEKERAIDSLIESADNYLNTAEYGKAAEILRKGIAQWPDNPDLYALYGETLLYLGYPEKALEKYKKATKLSPDVPDFHAGVGYSLLNIYLDRAKASIEAFKKALEIDPDNINALEGLGIVYASIDRKDLATDIYYRLKELDPDAAERLNNVIQNGIDWGE